MTPEGDESFGEDEDWTDDDLRSRSRSRDARTTPAKQGDLVGIVPASLLVTDKPSTLSFVAEVEESITPTTGAIPMSAHSEKVFLPISTTDDGSPKPGKAVKRASTLNFFGKSSTGVGRKKSIFGFGGRSQTAPVGS